jgi:enoyl-CoA hydratase/carnithine racemase
MWDQFAAVTASLHGSTLYRAVVITGGQRHFAAGADVKGPSAAAASWRSPQTSGLPGAPRSSGCPRSH